MKTSQCGALVEGYQYINTLFFLPFLFTAAVTKPKLCPSVTSMHFLSTPDCKHKCQSGVVGRVAGVWAMERAAGAAQQTANPRRHFSHEPAQGLQSTRWLWEDLTNTNERKERLFTA